MISKWWTVCRTEMRQLWRRRAFWIVHAILTLPALLLFVFGLFSRRVWIGTLDVTVPGQVTLGLYFLLIPVLVGPAIMRDLGKPGELLWSTASDPLLHMAGTFAGLWLGLVPGAVVHVASWWLASTTWPSLLSDLVWIYALLFYLATMSVGLALAILLSNFLRRTLSVLIIWVILWAMLTIQIAGLEDFIPAQESSLFNVYFNNIQMSPSLGLGPFQPLVISMLVWFAALSLLAFCLASIYSAITDSRKSVGRPAVFGMICLGAIMASGGGYALNQRAVQAHEMAVSPFDIQQELWRVDAHQMSIDVDPHTGYLAGNSTIRLTPLTVPNDSQLVLRLNPGLTLEVEGDESEGALRTRREGDGVVVELPEIPDEELTLRLVWEGMLHLPYQSYGLSWQYYDGPFQYRYDAPQPPGALLLDGIGYLLRDGDWYPWPWTAYPHQAAQNRIDVHTEANNALGTAPLDSGSAGWEGDMPEALVAFRPPQKRSLDGVNAHVGQLAGEQLVEKLGVYADALELLTPLLGEEPVRDVVALPYLGGFVWSRDLLLVPDSSGFYQNRANRYLLIGVVTPSTRPMLTRAAVYALARSWIFRDYPPEPYPFQRATANSERYFFTGQEVVFSRALWLEQRGRWVQPPEILDLAITWNPRRNVELIPSGEYAAVAFWLAMSLAGGEVLEGDLAQMAYLDTAEGQALGGGATYELTSGRIWPYILESAEARDLVRRFHDWATLVGRDEAIELLVDGLRQGRASSVERLMEELEQVSGVQFEEAGE